MEEKLICVPANSHTQERIGRWHPEGYWLHCACVDSTGVLTVGQCQFTEPEEVQQLIAHLNNWLRTSSLGGEKK